MEEEMRHSPFFADIDWSKPPKAAPDNIPPRPKTPPRIRNPLRRVNATWDLFAPVVEENHSSSAKKETD